MNSTLSAISSRGQLLEDQHLVSDVKLIELVGQGERGRVYKSISNSGEIMAVKIAPFWYDSYLNMAGEEAFEEMKAEAMKEARVHDALYHESIVQIYKVCSFQNNLVLHMEYIEGEPLWMFLEKNSFNLQKVDGINIFNQLSSAIEYIHQLHIAHGDLHMGHVLVDDNHNVKLIDFGSAVTGEDSDGARKRDIMHLNRIRDIIYSNLEDPGNVKNLFMRE